MTIIDLSDGIDDEMKAARKRWRKVRRAWIPAIKFMLASAADVVGDWAFFYRTKNADNALDQFEAPLYFFCCMSTVLGIFAVVSMAMKNHPNFATSARAKRCLIGMNWILGFEIFLEDIPQVALTTMVIKAKNGGEWTGVGVFNVTTSAFNFTFNILDMFLPLDEEFHVEEEEGLKEELLPTHSDGKIA